MFTLASCAVFVSILITKIIKEYVQDFSVRRTSRHKGRRAFLLFYRKIRILFKFNGEFSNSKNMQRFYHTVVKLNALLEVVSYTWLNF